MEAKIMKRKQNGKKSSKNKEKEAKCKKEGKNLENTQNRKKK